MPDSLINFILDCSEVPFMDSTAADVIEGTLRKAADGRAFLHHRRQIAGAPDTPSA